MCVGTLMKNLVVSGTLNKKTTFQIHRDRCLCRCSLFSDDLRPGKPHFTHMFAIYLVQMSRVFM